MLPLAWPDSIWLSDFVNTEFVILYNVCYVMLTLYGIAASVISVTQEHFVKAEKMGYLVMLRRHILPQCYYTISEDNPNNP